MHNAHSVVFEHMREAVLVVGPACRIIEVNRAAERYFGPRETLLDKPVEQVLPGWRPPDGGVELAQGAPHEQDLVWRPPGDDETRPVVSFRVVSLPLSSAGTPDGGWALLMRELTGGHGVDASLRHQREFFEAVISNSPVAIITINRRFRVLSWNPAAERLFGYTPQEAIGKNILQLVASAESVRSAGEQASREALQRGRVHSVTKRVRKDGTVVDVELLALPVSVGGEQLGFIAIYHDITDLQRARQAAEAANQAKGLFLATMSHEIRTPMNAIIGMTGLLLDTPLTSEQRDFVTTIRQSGEALLAQLNDVLDFSKIEAGRLDLEHHPFDVRQCVESVLDLLAPRAAEKSLDLGCLVAVDVPQMLVGDASRLRQVLLNLVGNAVKFTERGGVAVSVDVSRRPETPSGPYELRISVQDSGPGIATDKQEALFQPFSQLDASVSRRFGGTGLGLAISKRLVQAMGGRIWLEREGMNGQGATFVFTLSMPAAAQTPSGYLSPEQPMLRGRRVLVVDDNPISRKLLGLQLQSWGIEPVETGSGAEALAWLKAGARFDMAIVDHHMPVLDGPALAALIRERQETRGLPLVLLTSLGRRKPQLPGAFTLVLARPVKTSQLYDAVMTCLVSDVTQAQAIHAQAVQQASRFGERPGVRKPLRILLAEDNATNQKLALLVLERLGYRAEVAASGTEVLHALARQRYDVVLMDMQMPEMDGLEATLRIRREVPASEQPWIIAMTANALDVDRRRCIEAGMDDYLSKPLQVEALVAALERAQPRRPRDAQEGSSREVRTAAVSAPEPLTSLPEIPGLEPSALSRLWMNLGEQVPHVLPELIDTALDSMPGLLQEAHAALEGGDLDELGRAAHTLKSNAAYFGASALESVCRDIEVRADARNLEGVAELLSACGAELERTRLLLEQLRRAVRA